MCLPVSFDASFDCEQFFSRNAGICQKLPKTFCPVGETIRVNWASWCSMDCLEKQLRAFQVTLGRRLFVRIRCSWTSIFFFNCFWPLPYFTTTLITRKTASSLCLPLSLSVSRVSMWLRGCAKSLAVEFPEIICWEIRVFQEDFCFRTRCLLSIRLSTFGTSLLWNSSC